MAKKRKITGLKAERKRLLQNCEELINRFRNTSVCLRVGEAAAAAYESSSSTTAASASSSQRQCPSLTSLGDSEILVLVQAGIVQEWQVYLDAVFEMIVRHSLITCDLSRLPSRLEIDIKDIDPKSVSTVRGSTAKAARERFSFLAYSEKVKSMCNIFGVNVKSEDASVFELRKHVEIRNIFQHNRGTVREDDLRKIGKASYDIREPGGVQEYCGGQKIVLTSDEVDYLASVLESFSKNFEVLK